MLVKNPVAKFFLARKESFLFRFGVLCQQGQFLTRLRKKERKTKTNGPLLDFFISLWCRVLVF